MEMLSLYFELI